MEYDIDYDAPMSMSYDPSLDLAMEAPSGGIMYGGSLRDWWNKLKTKAKDFFRTRALPALKDYASQAATSLIEKGATALSTKLGTGYRGGRQQYLSSRLASALAVRPGMKRKRMGMGHYGGPRKARYGAGFQRM